MSADNAIVVGKFSDSDYRVAMLFASEEPWIRESFAKEHVLRFTNRTDALVAAHDWMEGEVFVEYGVCTVDLTESDDIRDHNRVIEDLTEVAISLEIGPHPWMYDVVRQAIAYLQRNGP